VNIVIESASDLEKYIVTENHEKWIACVKQAINGPAFCGPMYYFPAHAEISVFIPIDGWNLFIAGGNIRIIGAGYINNSYIYNRLQEAF
jgi:hypothetical protein